MTPEEMPSPENKNTDALKLMRKPFEPNQISKMCRPTKKDNPKERCNKCGGYHGIPAVQLSYVGHAALTDRLLDADPNWTWEPLSYAPDGTPFLDKDGGLWIKLTVAGVTRLGYGDAQGKMGGDAMKERIGDALRNAAMRFGAALELWHKGDLHADEEESGEKFTKQADGSFKKEEKNTQTVQAKPATKPVAKKTSPPAKTQPASPSPDKVFTGSDTYSGKNPPPATKLTSPDNIHGVTDIKDSEIPFPGDPEPSNPAGYHKRLPTDEETKAFRNRLIAVKNKGYTGLAPWILKTTGKQRTDDVPFDVLTKIVDQVEAAEKAGTLKELLAS